MYLTISKCEVKNWTSKYLVLVVRSEIKCKWTSGLAAALHLLAGAAVVCHLVEHTVHMVETPAGLTMSNMYHRDNYNLYLSLVYLLQEAIRI